MAMCSGLETVLLLFRGLTGSYSQRSPLSRQRSHDGRSSLHFFFFSLLFEPVSNSNSVHVAGGIKTYQCTQPGRKEEGHHQIECLYTA